MIELERSKTTRNKDDTQTMKQCCKMKRDGEVVRHSEPVADSNDPESVYMYLTLASLPSTRQVHVGNSAQAAA